MRHAEARGVIQLRPDQLEAVGALRRSLAVNQSVMFQAATGFGKTLIAAHIAKGAHAKGRRAVIAVHRRELLEQTSRTLTRFNIPHGIIAAGYRGDPFATVQIASADSLRTRRAWLADLALFVPDEAHLWAAKTRAEMIAEVRGHGGKIVGLSATPSRLDGRGLDTLFDAMVCGPSVEWLMEAGHLSRYRAFAPVRGNLDGLHVRAGEYITAELDERFGKPTVVGEAPVAWRQYAEGLRTMAFAYSRKHGADLTETYNRAGIPAVYIDGTSSREDRRGRIAAFADGEAMVLVSVNLCVEGFDLSAQVGREVPVEALALLRPTASLPLARQMIGRGLRPKVNPAVIMDHVSLLATHGLPDDPIEWTLAGRVGKRASPASAPSTMCGKCFFIARPFRVCPNCGEAVPVSDGRQVEEVAGELSELDIAAMRRDRLREQGQAKDFASLVTLGRARGYKSPEGWARHMIEARGQARVRERMHG